MFVCRVFAVCWFSVVGCRWLILVGGAFVLAVCCLSFLALGLVFVVC